MLSSIPGKSVLEHHLCREGILTQISISQHERYLLFPCDTPRGPRVSVFFHPDATTEDMLRSILHAAMVRSVLSKSTPWPGPEPALRSTLVDTHEWAHHDFPAFKRALEQRKWRTDELCFADLGNRVTWTP